MKRVRFRDTSGQIKQGRLSDTGITHGGRTYDPTAVSLAPPVEPSKVILVGRNNLSSLEASDYEPPTHPRLFTVPPSAVIGPDATIQLPPGKDHGYFGVEFGVVIGEQCRFVSQDDADDVIAGYTVVNDVSNNADIEIDPSKARVKGFDTAKPIGPVVASPDAVPESAEMELKVNGKRHQHGRSDNLNFSVPEIVEEVTRYFTLNPDDVVSMGTPAGVGELHPGDTVDATIEGIGTLTNRVESAPVG